MSEASDELRRSPLHQRHLALGAKLAAFGGWQMPLEYAGGGVLKEHAAVREAVGVFVVAVRGRVGHHGIYSDAGRADQPPDQGHRLAVGTQVAVG